MTDSAAVGRAGAAGAGAAAQGTAGGAGHVSDTVERSVQGTMKEASDINTEEALATLQSLAAKGGVNLSDLVAMLGAKGSLSLSDLTTAIAALNAKRTYDLSQSTDLSTQHGDITHRNAINNITQQLLQNAVVATDMLTKRAIENMDRGSQQAHRHGDVAIDGQWNPVQAGAGDTLTARAVSIDDASLKAIGAAVAAAVANAFANVGKPTA